MPTARIQKFLEFLPPKCALRVCLKVSAVFLLLASLPQIVNAEEYPKGKNPIADEFDVNKDRYVDGRDWLKFSYEKKLLALATYMSVSGAIKDSDEAIEKAKELVPKFDRFYKTKSNVKVNQVTALIKLLR